MKLLRLRNRSLRSRRSRRVLRSLTSAEALASESVAAGWHRGAA